MIIPVNELRILAVSCVLLLLGLVTLFDRRAGNASIALLLLSGGASGTVWCLWQVRGRLLRKQKLAVRAAQRALLREQRQRRHAAKRALRRERRELLITAKERLVRKQADERLCRQQTKEQHRLQKASREAALEAETSRLSALTAAALPPEVARIFARRGFRVMETDTEAPFDLLLTDPREARAVARCVPPERTAGPTDIRALEAWRRQAEAAHAYLISLSGFTLEAIAASQSLPITLVEAHLLAHWQSL